MILIHPLGVAMRMKSFVVASAAVVAFAAGAASAANPRDAVRAWSSPVRRSCWPI